MSVLRPMIPMLAVIAVLLAAGPAASAPGDQPVPPLPAGKLSDDKSRVRTASIPAHGMFVGDQLSESTKSQLTDLIIEALGLRVEVALLVPTGPWQIDGGTHADNNLTQARLAALRRFLTERGVDPKRIFVESHVDPRIKEPRLDVQLVGQPAND